MLSITREASLTVGSPRATLTLGTRSSRLAMWQATHVAALVEAAHADVRCDVVSMSTAGDRERDRPLTALGDKGAFTRDLEAALLEGRIDGAVHSLKDLPTDTPDGLSLAAVCARYDARDVLVSRAHATLDALPAGARVGTSSPRRRAQLLAMRPDLAVEPIRGNVDTRVGAALDGRYDAVVIAAAGVLRLGLESAVREYLPFDRMVPAPGQGALAVQCRAADDATVARLGAVDDAAARAEVTAERAFLAALGGGCRAPIAAKATVAGTTLELRGVVLAADGARAVRVVETGVVDRAFELGVEASRRARSEGAEALLR